MTRAFHIDDGLDAQVQSVLDGTADEKTRKRVEKRLAEDDELKIHYERLQATFEALDTIETVDPPAQIRRSIMQKVVAGRDQASTESPVKRRRRSPRPVGSREAFAFFAGAAAVALIAILSPGIMRWAGPTFEESVGTIGLESPGDPVDRWSWSEAWGRGEASLFFAASGRAVVRLHFDGPQPATFIVNFDPTQWEAVEFAAETPMRFKRELGPGRVELMAGRSNEAELGFRPLGPSPSPPWVEVEVRTSEGNAAHRLGETRSGELESRTNFQG